MFYLVKKYFAIFQTDKVNRFVTSYKLIVKRQN